MPWPLQERPTAGASSPPSLSVTACRGRSAHREQLQQSVLPLTALRRLDATESTSAAKSYPRNLRLESPPRLTTYRLDPGSGEGAGPAEPCQAQNAVGREGPDQGSVRRHMRGEVA